MHKILEIYKNHLQLLQNSYRLIINIIQAKKYCHIRERNLCEMSKKSEVENVKVTKDAAENVEAKTAEETSAKEKKGVKEAESAEAAETSSVSSEEPPVRQKRKYTKRKNTEKASEKKTKTAEKKTAKKDTVKETELSQAVYLQLSDGQYHVEDIVERIKEKYKSMGHRVSSIKQLRVYIKPMDNKAYFVINTKSEPEYFVDLN